MLDLFDPVRGEVLSYARTGNAERLELLLRTLHEAETR
jgi:hypothetical protein